MSDPKVRDLMKKKPAFISPHAGLKEAAQLMWISDCGFLPVGSIDNLVGVITDRDIVIRVLSHGKDPYDGYVAAYMSTNIYTCDETDDLEEAICKMYTHKVNRLMVKNRRGEVTGVLSFGTILRRDAETKKIISLAKETANYMRL